MATHSYSDHVLPYFLYEFTPCIGVFIESTLRTWYTPPILLLYTVVHVLRCSEK